VAGDINDHFSAFPRAMKLAVGTICVVDAQCTVLKCLWSLMDIFLAVERKKNDEKMNKVGKGSNYKLDFYTSFVDDNNSLVTVGLTDDFIRSDLHSLVKKREREMKFPLDLIEKAFDVDVKIADYANNKFIERFVKNAITGIPRNDPPAINHPSYDEFNLVLKGIFVSSSLDRLIKKHASFLDDLDKFLEALKSCKPSKISMDLSHCSNWNVGLAKRLFESLPSTVRNIYINLTGNKTSVSNTLSYYVRNLDRLEVLRIYGVKLNVASISALCSKHFTTIKSLALVDCDIQDSDMTEIIEIIQQCENLEEVDLSKNNILEHGLSRIHDMLVKYNGKIQKFHLSKTCDLNPLEIELRYKKIVSYYFSEVRLHL